MNSPSEQGNDDDLVKVIVRMPSWLHEAVKECAEAEERSMATVIRRAVRAYIGIDR